VVNPNEKAHPRAQLETIMSEKLKSNGPSNAAACSPVAWLHALDTTEGIPENEPWKILSFDETHPFGEPGIDYSAEYGLPVSTPLYFRQNS
jgi:hypothetical protein